MHKHSRGRVLLLAEINVSYKNCFVISILMHFYLWTAALVVSVPVF